MLNPLREERRNKPVVVLSLKREWSLLDWLESRGRLIAGEVHECYFRDNAEELESLMVINGISDYGFDDKDKMVPI